MTAPVYIRSLIGAFAATTLVLSLAACTSLKTAKVEKRSRGGVPREHCEFPEVAPADCAASAMLSGCRTIFARTDSSSCYGDNCDPGACAKPSPPTSLLAHTAKPVPAAPHGAGVIPAAERNALLAIFNATGGNTWYSRTGWGDAAGTECTWYGVTCNDAGTTVTGLEFRSNNLTGSLPPDIAALKNLKRLHIDEFYLGALPSKIGQLAKLEELFLGTLYPVTGLPTTLGNLHALKRLTLDGMYNLAALPATLGALPALEVLDLTSLPVLHTLPDELSGLAALQQLHIQDVPLESFPGFIAQLPALRLLMIQDMPSLTGALPPGLGNLSNLELLYLENTAISGSLPAQLGNLAKLKVLVVRFNPSLGGPIPAELGNIATLQGLNLPGNALSGKIPGTLGNLAQLENLNLALNQLSGSIPLTLRNLTKLRGLYLAGNQLSGTLPPMGKLTHLRALMLGPNQFNAPLPASVGTLPDLEILFLRKAGLTGPLPDLGAATKLTFLNLSENPFDAGPVPGWLETLPAVQSIGLIATNRTGRIPNLSALASQLTYLGLGQNDFRFGPIPAWIGSMTKLEGLELAKSRRTGALPAFLGGLAELSALDVSANEFDAGPIPDFLNYANLPRLEYLNLSKTHRTGPIPAAVWDLLPLSDLRLADNQLTGPLTDDVQKPLLNLLDLSRNALAGPLPPLLSTQVRMASLRLNGNDFSGEIPIDYQYSLLDEDMIDGVEVDPFGEEFVGADLRYNRLTSSNLEILADLQQKHPNGLDFRLTQTVPPTNVDAAAKSASVIRLTWTPIDFRGDGRYIVAMSANRTGPFTNVKSVSPKSARAVDVGGLSPGTKYFFRVRTESAASDKNPNVLVSVPSGVVSASTQ